MRSNTYKTTAALWKYAGLACMDVLVVVGFWLSLVIFRDRKIVEESMLYFTVTDIYQIFVFPLYAVVHGVISRLLLKTCVVAHVVLLLVTCVGISLVRTWPLFSTEVWIFVLLTLGISLVMYWLTAGIQALFCRREF